jgi:3-isopropylmalate/(R)-2-methylmalate dehydratase large subunit
VPAAFARERERPVGDPLDLARVVFARVVRSAVVAHALRPVVEAADELADDEEVDRLTPGRAQVRVDVELRSEANEPLFGPNFSGQLGFTHGGEEDRVRFLAGDERLGRKRVAVRANRRAAEGKLDELGFHEDGEGPLRLSHHLGPDAVSGEAGDVHAPIMREAVPKTLFDRIWESHIVREERGEPALVYVDLHLIHEVTSAQAFEGLRLAGRGVRRPDLAVATMDHNVPTDDRPIADPVAMVQLEALERNCAEFGIPLFATGSGREGIVHVIGPELGLTQPGMTIACGDSHTSTHGAFGAYALGIGTSDVEQVLATQCLAQSKPKTMRILFEGGLPLGVTAKDMILGAIGRLGVGAGAGYVFEYAGEVVRSFSMAERMTVCNMSIEAGARAGMIAPDETTFAYLEGLPAAPKGAEWEHALEHWRALASHEDAVYDAEVAIDVSELAPQVSWGTTPAMVAPVDGRVPDPHEVADPDERGAVERALVYMALEPGTAIEDIELDRVFIGSCTNARIEDLRVAAGVVRGKRVHPRVRAMVVPGSAAVKRHAEAEGLDRIFEQAGFEWRRAGCSMCLGMNPDVLAPGERCASTSNRNFEGRQGRGGRTHLVSPAMAAAAALAGHFVDTRARELAPA